MAHSQPQPALQQPDPQRHTSQFVGLPPIHRQSSFGDVLDHVGSNFDGSTSELAPTLYGDGTISPLGVAGGASGGREARKMSYGASISQRPLTTTQLSQISVPKEAARNDEKMAYQHQQSAQQQHHQQDLSKPTGPVWHSPVNHSPNSSEPRSQRLSPPLHPNGQLPPGQWQEQNSKLAQPLTPTRPRGSPRNSPDPLEEYAIDKETGAPRRDRPVSSSSEFEEDRQPVRGLGITERLQEPSVGLAQVSKPSPREVATASGSGFEPEQRFVSPTALPAAAPTAPEARFEPQQGYALLMPNPPFAQGQGDRLGRSDASDTTSIRTRDESASSKRNSGIFTGLKQKFTGGGEGRASFSTSRPGGNDYISDARSERSLPTGESRRKRSSLNILGLREDGKQQIADSSGYGTNQRPWRPAEPEPQSTPKTKKRFSKLTGLLSRDYGEESPIDERQRQQSAPGHTTTSQYAEPQPPYGAKGPHHNYNHARGQAGPEQHGPIGVPNSVNSRPSLIGLASSSRNSFELHGLSAEQPMKTEGLSSDQSRGYQDRSIASANPAQQNGAGTPPTEPPGLAAMQKPVRKAVGSTPSPKNANRIASHSSIDSGVSPNRQVSGDFVRLQGTPSKLSIGSNVTDMDGDGSTARRDHMRAPSAQQSSTTLSSEALLPSPPTPASPPFAGHEMGRGRATSTTSTISQIPQHIQEPQRTQQPMYSFQGPQPTSEQRPILLTQTQTAPPGFRAPQQSEQSPNRGSFRSEGEMRHGRHAEGAAPANSHQPSTLSKIFKGKASMSNLLSGHHDQYHPSVQATQSLPVVPSAAKAKDSKTSRLMGAFKRTAEVPQAGQPPPGGPVYDFVPQAARADPNAGRFHRDQGHLHAQPIASLPNQQNAEVRQGMLQQSMSQPYMQNQGQWQQQQPPPHRMPVTSAGGTTRGSSVTSQFPPFQQKYRPDKASSMPQPSGQSHAVQPLNYARTAEATPAPRTNPRGGGFVSQLRQPDRRAASPAQEPQYGQVPIPQGYAHVYSKNNGPDPYGQYGPGQPTYTQHPPYARVDQKLIPQQQPVGVPQDDRQPQPQSAYIRQQAQPLPRTMTRQSWGADGGAAPAAPIGQPRPGHSHPNHLNGPGSQGQGGVVSAPGAESFHIKPHPAQVHTHSLSQDLNHSSLYAISSGPLHDQRLAITGSASNNHNMSQPQDPNGSQPQSQAPYHIDRPEVLQHRGLFNPGPAEPIAENKEPYHIDRPEVLRDRGLFNPGPAEPVAQSEQQMTPRKMPDADVDQPLSFNIESPADAVSKDDTETCLPKHDLDPGSSQVPSSTGSAGMPSPPTPLSHEAHIHTSRPQTQTPSQEPTNSRLPQRHTSGSSQVSSLHYTPPVTTANLSHGDSTPRDHGVVSAQSHHEEDIYNATPRQTPQHTPTPTRHATFMPETTTMAPPNIASSVPDADSPDHEHDPKATESLISMNKAQDELPADAQHESIPRGSTDDDGSSKPPDATKTTSQDTTSQQDRKPSPRPITPPSPTTPTDNFSFEYTTAHTKLSHLPTLTTSSSPPPLPSHPTNQPRATTANGKPIQTSVEIFEEHKRKQLLREQEEKIPVNPTEPDLDAAAVARNHAEVMPTMSATSYPGQEWNPFEDAEFGGHD